MSIKPWHLAIAVLLAALAGCIGALAADRWIRANDEPTLHEFVHDELELTAEQSKQLETLEAAYAVEYKELELALRAANARLARAMDDEHEFGPEVAAAIDEAHARALELTHNIDSQTVYWPVDNLADLRGSREERLRAYRAVRDDIAAKLGVYLETEIAVKA